MAAPSPYRLPPPQKPPRRRKPLTLGASIRRFNKLPPIGKTPTPRAGTNPAGTNGGASGASGAASPAPTLNPNTYPEYAQFPWAQAQLAQIDRDKAFAIQNGQQVGDWLSKALTGLTGVSPGASGLGPALQQQYQQNVAGPVAGALNAAAQASNLPNISTGIPGGVAASPTAYLSGAMGEFLRNHAANLINQSQIQGSLNTLQGNTYGQSLLKAYADAEAGLPAVYTQRTIDARAKIDDTIAKLQQAAETQRHNKVMEAIGAQNAQNGLLLGAGKLGLDATKIGNQQAAVDTAAATPAPYGYVRDPATGKLLRDPSVPQASSTSTKPKVSNKPLSAASISSMNGSWARPKGSPPKLGAGWKQPVWDPGTKKWYAKRATTAKAYTPKGATSLQASLMGLWKPGGVDNSSVEYRFNNNPKGAGGWIAQWVQDNLKDFYRPGSKKIDLDKVFSVLSAIGGRPVQMPGGARDIILSHIQHDGTWK